MIKSNAMLKSLYAAAPFRSMANLIYLDDLFLRKIRRLHDQCENICNSIESNLRSNGICKKYRTSDSETPVKSPKSGSTKVFKKQYLPKVSNHQPAWDNCSLIALQ